MQSESPGARPPRTISSPTSALQRSGTRSTLPGSAATRPPHTRPQPCKHCVASARRRNYAVSFLIAENFLQQCFEARTAAQWVEKRFNFKVNKIGMILIAFFNPVEGLLFSAEPE